MLEPDKIEIRNQLDADGKPAGGHARVFTHSGLSDAVYVRFQDGPLGRGPDRKPRNGAFVEDLLYIAQKRLEFYNRAGFACDENDAAIHAIKQALEALISRTSRREAAGVEGTHEGK